MSRAIDMQHADDRVVELDIRLSLREQAAEARRLADHVAAVRESVLMRRAEAARTIVLGRGHGEQLRDEWRRVQEATR